MPFAIVTDHYRASGELNRLRTNGHDLSRAKDWQGLHAIQQELRGDSAFWVELWGPLCAAAARHVGDPQARALLDEVIEAGFHQPEAFAEELESAFGQDEDWAELRERIAKTQPPAPVTLLDWPTITPSAPLCLFRLEPEREALLREMIPAPSPTAWATAKELTVWVSSQWRHANVHMEVDDAVLCLERAATGARFACVEYSLVLTQALNALGIPARKLSLAQKVYHAGVGRGHVVSEAWIDDLNRWVLLDGQNGLYWTDASGNPLGLRELLDLRRNGAPAPSHVKGGEPFDDKKIQLWYSYFDYGTCTAGTARANGYVPIFQRNFVHAAVRLEHDPSRLYPDLSEIAVGVDVVDSEVAIRLTSPHPFATGFDVASSRSGDTWILDSTPGEHRIELRTRTPYGPLAPKTLLYEV